MDAFRGNCNQHDNVVRSISPSTVTKEFLPRRNPLTRHRLTKDRERFHTVHMKDLVAVTPFSQLDPATSITHFLLVVRPFVHQGHNLVVSGGNSRSSRGPKQSLSMMPRAKIAIRLQRRRCC